MGWTSAHSNPTPGSAPYWAGRSRRVSGTYPLRIPGKKAGQIVGLPGFGIACDVAGPRADGQTFEWALSASVNDDQQP